jgi:hypothetical protein
MAAGATLFSSNCPKCRRARQQRGYRASELTLLFKLGIGIGAHCIFCNERWMIPAEERAALGRALSARN